MNITGTKILITGGGRGIGHHLVDRFIQDGAIVCVFDKNNDLCSKLLSQYGGSVKTYQCDVSNEKSIDLALKQAEDDGFTADVLINNAGIIHSEPLLNLSSRDDRKHSSDAWHAVISTNLDSVFFVTSRVVEQMVSRRFKGVIISISSISATGNTGQSAYSAAKAGVNALTRTWSKELGALGIRFVAISPGFLDTESTHNSLNEAIITRLKQQIPLRRLGLPENIYMMTRQLIENDYITGTVIDIHGGLSI